METFDLFHFNHSDSQDVTKMQQNKLHPLLSGTSAAMLSPLVWLGDVCNSLNTEGDLGITAL